MVTFRPLSGLQVKHYLIKLNGQIIESNRFQE